MKIKKKEVFVKKVTYFGYELEVPVSVKFIAADSDGFVYGSEKEPIFNPESGKWLQRPTSMGDLNWVFIATCDLGETLAKNSLREV